jgi:hypothetical protein
LPTLDRFAREKGLNLFRSGLHDSGRVMAMCGFKALNSNQVKEVWSWFLQGRLVPVTTKGEACYVGEIASLPGLGGGSAFESGAEMQAEILFGEVARQLKALNQNLAWAQTFYEQLSAVSGERPVAPLRRAAIPQLENNRWGSGARIVRQRRKLEKQQEGERADRGI